MQVQELWRYPVKGFSGERLESVTLEQGGFFPQDREWALENGESGFNATAFEHQPKTAYVMLMRHAKLALIKSRLKGEILTLNFNGESVAANLATAQGRALVEGFVQEVMGEEVSHLKLLHAPPQARFTDFKHGYVSLINLESVRALQAPFGQDIDPVRFRGNLLIDGLPAFAENELVNFHLQIGDCVFKVLKRTVRCAATTVNPLTGERDMFIPSMLHKAYGHSDCGLYLEVLQGGHLEQGMSVKIHEPALMGLPFA